MTDGHHPPLTTNNSRCRLLHKQIHHLPQQLLMVRRATHSCNHKSIIELSSSNCVSPRVASLRTSDESGFSAKVN